MVYRHDGDLATDYPLPQAFKILEEPFFRELFHDRAEADDLLNTLGHEVVCSSLGRMAGGIDKGLGGLGVTLYEIITMPTLAGCGADDVTGREDDYRDKVFDAAYSLECYDPIEMMELTNTAVDMLNEDAPVLSGLVEMSARSILREAASDLDIRRIKVGVGLMRTLGITVEHRMAGGSLSD